MMMFCAFFSERINSRVLSTVILQLWALPLLSALYTFDKGTSQWVYFAVVSLICGFPYIHPIQVRIVAHLACAWFSTRLFVGCMGISSVWWRANTHS